MGVNQLEIKVHENNSTPLVSIVVITYNSAKYLLETLESAKAQTYQNIELIISDDCSTDNTVEICKSWIAVNKSRFVRAALITVESNSGIPANCNRGVKEAKGDWVKLIAGDDLLIENNIELNIIYSNKYDLKFVASNILEFTGNISSPSSIRPSVIPKKFSDLKTVEEQFIYFLTGNNYLYGCAFFLNKTELLKIGGFLENYKLVEDIPLLLNWTFNNNFIGFMNDFTVYYRKHSGGLTAKNTFPNYLLYVCVAVIDFSFRSGKLFYLINGLWNLSFLKLEQKFSRRSFSKIIRKFRLGLQPIRILWFKKIFTARNV